MKEVFGTDNIEKNMARRWIKIDGTLHAWFGPDGGVQFSQVAKQKLGDNLNGYSSFINSA